MKKLLFASALTLPLVFSDAKSFEFPEKLPYGDVSANVGYYSQYVGEVSNRMLVSLQFKEVLITAQLY